MAWCYFIFIVIGNGMAKTTKTLEYFLLSLYILFIFDGNIDLELSIFLFEINRNGPLYDVVNMVDFLNIRKFSGPIHIILFRFRDPFNISFGSMKYFHLCFTFYI